MKISTKIVGSQTKINDFPDTFGGRNAVVRPTIYIITFDSQEATIQLEVSENSKLYEDLGMFVSKKGLDSEFTFEIGGEHVDAHYDKKFVELMGKLSKLSEESEGRLNKVIEQKEHIQKLNTYIDIIETKWWYRLFNFFK